MDIAASLRWHEVSWLSMELSNNLGGGNNNGNGSKGATTGGRGSGPPTFLLTHNFGQQFTWRVGLALLHCNKVDYFKIYLSTFLQIEWFEVQNSKKKSGEGLTKPPPQTPPSDPSSFAFDWGFARFGPPTFEAWLCPWVVGEKGVDRARKTWRDCVKDDMEELGLHSEWKVFRDMWRGFISGYTSDPNWVWKKWTFWKYMMMMKLSWLTTVIYGIQCVPSGEEILIGRMPLLSPR